MIEDGLFAVLSPQKAILGTGFLVAETLGVTSWHAWKDFFQQGHNLPVQFYAQRERIVLGTIERAWPEEDVALIRFERGHLPPRCRPLPLWKARGAQGHDFFVLGYPTGTAAEARSTQGKIGAVVPGRGHLTHLLQLDGLGIDRGFSGAPVWDFTIERVVGMVVGYQDLPRRAQSPEAPLVRLAYAILAEDLWSLSSEIVLTRPAHTTGFVPAPADHARGVRLETLWPEPSVLIGHQRELRTMLTAFHQRRKGWGGALFLIESLPGFGGNALVRAFLDALPAEDVLRLGVRFVPDGEMPIAQPDPLRETLDATDGLFAQSPPFLGHPDAFPLKAVIAQLAHHERVRPEHLPRHEGELGRFFRFYSRRQRPIVLALEDFHYAPKLYAEWLQHIANEIRRDLPLFVVLSGEALTSPSEAVASPWHALARAWRQTEHIIRVKTRKVSQDEIASYIGNAVEGIAAQLHQLSGGIPYLVEDLWVAWRNKGYVIRKASGRWEHSPTFPFGDIATGEEYIARILEELYALEPPPDLAKATLLQMLTLAAQEGPVFTLEALATTFNLEPALLEEEIFSFLIDDVDEDGLYEPGLLFPETLVEIEVIEGGKQKTLERYRFQPLLVWQTLREKADTLSQEMLLAFAERLRAAYFPDIRRIAPTLCRLYEAGGQGEQAELYRQWLYRPNPFADILAHLDILATFPPTAVTQSQQLTLYAQLGTGYIHWDARDAERRFATMLTVAEALNNRHYVALALFLLGNAKHQRGKNKEALALYEQALPIMREVGDRAGEAATLNNMARVYYATGRPGKALELYEQALPIRREVGDRAGEAATLNNMALVYDATGRPGKALELYEQALPITREVGDRAGEAAILANMAGLFYQSLARPQEAIDKQD